MELDILTQLGLNIDEAKVYESLLESGSQSASNLSQSTQIKRTYIYYVCQALVEKGLITVDKRERATVFYPRSPDILLSLASAQKEKSISAERALEGILISLKAKYLAREEKPIVSTFEGFDGVKKIYLETLNEGKDIYAMLQTSEVEPTLREWLKNEYTLKRAELGIHAHVILASGTLSKEYQSRNKQANRTVLEVPNNLFPFAHEINIFGDKIAFINYKKGEPLVGIVITHKHMAQTMKAWFDLAWIGAQKYK